MVNAVQARWADLVAINLEATVQRFLAIPAADEFCVVHRVGGDFSFLEHGRQALPIPRAVLHAETLTDVAHAFQLDPEGLLPLNPWTWAGPRWRSTMALGRSPGLD